MIKRITYISILILWGCNTLVEQTTPLEGDFYIQDGWLAFTSRKYDQADKHFNTAIETNDSGSVVHFLSLVGLGWTHIYKAYLNQETSVNGFVVLLLLVPSLPPVKKATCWSILPTSRIVAFSVTPNVSPLYPLAPLETPLE